MNEPETLLFTNVRALLRVHEKHKQLKIKHQNANESDTINEVI